MVITKSKQYLFGAIIGMIIGGTTGFSIQGIPGAILGMIITSALMCILLDITGFWRTVRKICGQFPQWKPDIAYWKAIAKFWFALNLFFTFFFLTLFFTLCLPFRIAFYSGSSLLEEILKELENLVNSPIPTVTLLFTVIFSYSETASCIESVAKGIMRSAYWCSPFGVVHYTIVKLPLVFWSSRKKILEQIKAIADKLLLIVQRVLACARDLFVAIHSSIRMTLIIYASSGYLLGFWMFSESSPILSGIEYGIIASIFGCILFYFVQEKLFGPSE